LPRSTGSSRDWKGSHALRAAAGAECIGPRRLYLRTTDRDLERDIPTSLLRFFGPKVGVRKCRRTACRTRSLRPRSTCRLATAMRSVDLSERTKKGHFRRYFEHSPSSVRGMHAPDAVAGDPMIDGIALKVALSSCDTNGRRVGSAHRQSAQFPYMHLGRKSVSGRLFR
jgi:hypothetical protein